MRRLARIPHFIATLLLGLFLASPCLAQITVWPAGPETTFQSITLGGTKVATNSTINFLSGAQNVTGTITGAFAPFNILQITESVAVPSGAAQGLFIQLNTGGAAATGGRVGILGTVNIFAATGNNGGQYTAVQGEAYGSASDTNAIIYGGNFTAQLQTNTTMGQVVGAEIDVGIQSGSSAVTKTGLQVVPFGNDAVAGSGGKDSAYVIGDQSGAKGFDYGFRISGVSSSYPIKTTGTVFWADSSVAGTVANGFDLSSLTITGAAWKSTGATLSGAGAFSGLSLTAQGVTNKVVITGSGAGVAPTVYAQGNDTNVGLNIAAQGSLGIQLQAYGGATNSFQAFSEPSADRWITVVSGTASIAPFMYVNGNADNIVLGGGSGGSAIVATSATAGFVIVPAMDGTPSATPAHNSAGAVLVYDRTDKRLYVYDALNAGWHYATFN
jgi:hypothetical protein